MNHRTLTRFIAVILLTVSTLSAREWKSADGKKTFEAAFVAVKGDKLELVSAGKPSSFPLAAFCAEDQTFAKNAAYIADAATKLGPQSFEFSHLANGGWVCRLALKTPAQTGPTLFTGEIFFLATPDAAKHQVGEHFTNQLLYGAGGRTYHPLTGDPSPIRAFSLNAETATQVWTDVMAQSGDDMAKQAPPVLEPDIQIITTRGVGIVIGKKGIVVTDPALIKDAKTISVHHDGKDHPASVVPVDGKLDLALLATGLDIEPARLAAKKPPELGQSIMALNLELNSTRKDFVKQPALTRGIISRLSTSGDNFQHDAVMPPESAGGFIVGEKGDVFGIYFQNQTTSKSTPKKGDYGPRDVAGLGSCISTQALATLMTKVKGAGDLKTATTETDIQQLAKTLMSSAVLIVATREFSKPRSIAATKAAPAAAGATPPAGWSLSKSGTRHNSKCRYYDAQKTCPQTEGQPCKICGG